MSPDEQQIRQLIEQWNLRTAQGDLDGVLSLMTDDAVFLRAGAPPMDKKAFAEGFRAWSGKARIESRHEFKDLHASGDTAYAWAQLSVAMTSKESGEKMQRAGPVLTVFRKTPAGKWLLARDANLIS